MVSKQETARPLLTPGEVMQLPPSDELVLISGLAPIRAKKLRYYADRNFTARVKPAPELTDGPYRDRPVPRRDDWSGQVRGLHAELLQAAEAAEAMPDVSDEGGLQQQRAPGGEDGVRSILVSKEPAGEQEYAHHGEASVVSLDEVRRAHAMNEAYTHRSLDDDLLPSF